MKKLIFIILIFLFSSNIFAQQEYPLSRQDSALIIKYQAAFEVQDNLGKLKEASDNLNSIAMIYWEHNHYAQATTFYEESLIRNEKLENENAIAMINSNLALINADMGNYEKALTYFEKTLASRIANKETIGIIAALINRSVVYNNLKQFDKSIESLTKALDYAREMNDPEQMRSCYGMLAETYEKKGDTKNSLYYFDYYKSFHEMIQNEKVAKVGEELESEKLKLLLSKEQIEKDSLSLRLKEYQLINTQKELNLTDSTNKSLIQNLTRQELEFEYFRKENELKDLQNQQVIQKKQKTLSIIIIIAISLIFIILIGSFAYLVKRKDNEKLKYQNQQILQQREEIMQQNSELEYAKSEIEKINDKLMSSINYAKFIQVSTLNKKSFLNTLVKESLIYYIPRDTVSGDFYWFNKVGNKIIIAAIDCTGHGVPGGFLSMIGNELMNKIVLFEEITNPAEILKSMDKSISITLNQENSKNNDGMDMALCTLDYTENTLIFAGANNPMVLIQDDVMQIIKGNKSSIGGHRISEKIFENKNFKITNNTYFYLFSDGYIDQLGGPKGRSLGTKFFANLLFENHKKNVEEQAIVLKKTFENWTVNEKQIDDILILGVKL